MFCVGDIGMLVNRCVPQVLLMANPVGKEVVFSNDPSAEYTFMTALIS